MKQLWPSILKIPGTGEHTSKSSSGCYVLKVSEALSNFRHSRCSDWQQYAEVHEYEFLDAVPAYKAVHEFYELFGDHASIRWV